MSELLSSLIIGVISGFISAILDAFSGAGKMFSMNYYDMSSTIIEGQFRAGNSTEIKN